MHITILLCPYCFSIVAAEKEMSGLTEAEIQQWKEKIDKMSQTEMAHLRRFAPSGHVVFDSSLPLNTYFEERFKKLGGMTPDISKKIGWNP